MHYFFYQIILCSFYLSCVFLSHVHAHTKYTSCCKQRTISYKSNPANLDFIENDNQLSDPFGVKFLYSSMENGHSYYSTSWNNGKIRQWKYASDPYDAYIDCAHGDATYSVNGKGVLMAKGDYVRIYIHDPLKKTEWRDDLEITVYITRIAESKQLSYSGLQIFAHTNHGVTGKETRTPCDCRGYGARVKNDGTWSFEKETKHDGSKGYTESPGWCQPWPVLPINTTVGIKYVIKYKSTLELWKDVSSNGNGQTWKLIYTFTDTGKNFGVGADRCKKKSSPADIFTCDFLKKDSESGYPCMSVYFRCEYCTMSFQKLTIREINSSGFIYI